MWSGEQSEGTFWLRWSQQCSQDLKMGEWGGRPAASLTTQTHVQHHSAWKWWLVTVVTFKGRLTHSWWPPLGRPPAWTDTWARSLQSEEKRSVNLEQWCFRETRKYMCKGRTHAHHKLRVASHCRGLSELRQGTNRKCESSSVHMKLWVPVN